MAFLVDQQKSPGVFLSQEKKVAKCPQCGGPMRPYYEGLVRKHRLGWQRSDYCGYYVKPDLFDKVVDEAKAVHHAIGNLATLGLGLIFMGVFAIVILAVLGAFSNAPDLFWPNSSTISNQLAKSVTAASGFLSILILTVTIGFMMFFVGILFHLASSQAGETKKVAKTIAKELWSGKHEDDTTA